MPTTLVAEEDAGADEAAPRRLTPDRLFWPCTLPAAVAACAAADRMRGPR